MMPNPHIPNLWEKDWRGAYEEAGEVDRRLIGLQVEAAHLLKNVDDREATPHRLAWMLLWTRVFHTLDGARAALLRNSGLVLRMLGRAIGETNLIVHTICEPLGSGRDDASNQILDRMAAYTVWCLWNDRQFYDKMLDRRNLDPIWNNDWRYEMAGRPEELEAFESLFGPLEIEAPEGLQKKRRQMEEYAWDAQKRIDQYLDLPELRKWFRRLDERRRQEKWVRTFFELIDDTNRSIRRRFRSIGLEYAYFSDYQPQSTLLHGSTLDQSMRWIKDTVYPKFYSTDETDFLAKDIGSECKRVLVLLAVMKKNIW